MKNIIMWMRSILFFFAFYIWALMIAICCLWSLLLPPKVVIQIAQLWCKGNRFLLWAICGIKVKVKGLSNLPKQNGYLVASKHQSALETVMFHALLSNSIYVLKQSLMYMPLAGWYFARSGCIAVNREKGTSAMRKMLEKAKDRLNHGFNIIIFPEGTRTKPGSTPKYNPGVAMIYDIVKVPVVPVALNTGYFWPKNSFKRYPGTVIFEFLEPIEPGLEKRVFLKELENKIETACAKQKP